VIKLFKTKLDANRRSLVFPKMSYVQKRINENTIRAIDYYRASGETVRSNHPLVTLINTMNVVWSGDKERFFDICDSVSPSVCNALKIGGAIHSAKLARKGWFYGYEEVLLSVELDRTSNKPWYELEPLKVFSHGRTDITYTLLNGVPNTNEESFSVIGIDAAMLMYMFICWRQYQLKVYPDNPQTTGQFIANWVLPNMIRSHNDVAWLNRLSRILEGTYPKPADTLKRIPFSLSSSETFTHDVLTAMRDRFTEQSYEWADVLSSVPLPSGTTGLAYAQTPYFAPTRLGKAMACLTTMDYLILLGTCKPNPENSKHLVEFERVFKRLNNENWYSDSVLSTLVNMKMDFIYNRLFS
jgi:hypothetical protein